ncbi:MAG TPA: helix-turn-helix transcriptional regulator, partial [Symbiobacteriaceae bacterium]|nr:helix-turn-helix transcriptional regulator [Symbiobacteriaceae bacterium]
MNEIGRRLRAAREAKGLSLEVVEEETKIRRKYVEALEAGQEDVLPGDAYTKGFLRTYGNYLGLDGTALVEEYKRSKERHDGGHGPASVSAAAQRHAPPRQQLSAQEREERREALRRDAAAVREVARTRGGEAEPEPVPAITRQEFQHSPRPRRPIRKESSGSLRTLGIAAVVLALIGAVSYLGWVIFNQAAPPETKTEPPQTTPQTTVTQPESTPPPKLPDPPKVTMSKANATDVVFAVPAAEVSVTVEPTSGGVWLKPTIDGKDQVDATVSKATEFKGKEVRLRMGHMNGV